MPHWAARVVGRVYRAYYRSLRVRVLMPDGSVTRVEDYPHGCEVIALCERDALALVGATRGRPFMFLVAHGRDGDWASAALEGGGVEVVRGSSRRGGTRALRAIVRGLDQGRRSLGLVVDGPLGPAGVAKRGVVGCAVRTGRPLRAVAAAARYELTFRRAWSAIYIPLPFSRVVVVCDAPLCADASPTRDNLEALRQELTARLACCRRQAVDVVRHRGDLWRPAIA